MTHGATGASSAAFGNEMIVAILHGLPIWWVALTATTASFASSLGSRSATPFRIRLLLLSSEKFLFLLILFRITGNGILDHIIVLSIAHFTMALHSFTLDLPFNQLTEVGIRALAFISPIFRIKFVEKRINIGNLFNKD